MSRIEIRMPPFGQSVAEGTVVQWLKSPGDLVAADESVLAIETDKAETEVPAPAAGRLARIAVAEGETVEVGALLGELETDGAVAVSGAAAPVPAAPAHAEMPSARPVPRPAAHSGGASDDPRTGGFLSPAVRRLARERGLSFEAVRALDGSGRAGRVTLADLDAWLRRSDRPEPEPDVAHVDDVTVIPMTGLRARIAHHVSEAKRTIPHVNTVTEADLSNIVAARKQHRGAFESRHGVSLSYTAFFLKASAEALVEFPMVNAVLDERGIVTHRSVHLGMAVALEPSGLVVPVIRHAHRLSVREIALEAARLAEKARSRQLLPDDMQGGTCTVTNPGVFGTLLGTPIIHAPQAAIVDFGAMKKRVIVTEDDAIAIRPMAYVVLAWDHRVMDGATASRFLRRLVTALQSMPVDSID